MNPAPEAWSVPPGWYPDPSGAPVQRFWDGNAWTAQTAGYPVAGPQRRPPWIPWIIAGVAVVLIVIALLVTWVTRPSRYGQPGQPGQHSQALAMPAAPADLDGSSHIIRGSLVP